VSAINDALPSLEDHARNANIAKELDLWAVKCRGDRVDGYAACRCRPIRVRWGRRAEWLRGAVWSAGRDACREQR
jgi:hypothetical protein